jgi:hypothetical protein
MEHTPPADMTIEQLRACLQKEGVDYSGTKAVLVIRLDVVRNLEQREKGSDKRKREEIASLITCPVCEEICLPPTKQCDNGHLVCTACVEKLPAPKICPSCRVSLDHMSRSLIAEQMCASLPVPCSFKEAGCTHAVAHEDYKAHVETCDFRPFHCLIKDCEWQGPLEEFVEHMEQKHHCRRKTSKGWSLHWDKGTNICTSKGTLNGLTDDEQVVFSLVWGPKRGLRVVFWHVSRSPRDTKKWRIKITMSGPQGVENSWCRPIADLRTSYDEAIERATTLELSCKQAALFDYGLNAKTLLSCPMKKNYLPGDPVLCFAAQIYRYESQSDSDSDSDFDSDFDSLDFSEAEAESE